MIQANACSQFLRLIKKKQILNRRSLLFFQAIAYEALNARRSMRFASILLPSDPQNNTALKCNAKGDFRGKALQGVTSGHCALPTLYGYCNGLQILDRSVTTNTDSMLIEVGGLRM